MTGIAMVCISYLGVTGSPSHLRYLMLRPHRRLPGMPVLMGLWPSEDDAPKGDRVRAVIGAGHCSTSLREAADSCAEAAHRAAEAGGSETAPPRAA